MCGLDILTGNEIPVSASYDENGVIVPLVNKIFLAPYLTKALKAIDGVKHLVFFNIKNKINKIAVIKNF